MENPKGSIFEKAIDPVLQAGLTLAAVLVVIILGKFINAIGLTSVSERFPWLTAASFLLFLLCSIAFIP